MRMVLDSGPEDIEVRPVGPGEASWVDELDRRVISLEKDELPDFVGSHTDFLNTVRGRNPGDVAFGAWLGGVLAGRCAVNLKPDARDYEAAGGEVLRLVGSGRCVYFHDDLVDPAWRGRGVQSAMIGFRVARMARKGYAYALADVLDTRPASFRNYREEGFHVVCEIPCEDGLHRLMGMVLNV